MTPEVSLCGNMMMNRYNLFSTLLEQVSLDWRSLNFLKAGFPWLFYCMATVRMSLATTTTSNVVPKLFFLNPEPYCIITSSKYEGYRDLILVDINKCIINQPNKNIPPTLRRPSKTERRTCFLAMLSLSAGNFFQTFSVLYPAFSNFTFLWAGLMHFSSLCLHPLAPLLYVVLETFFLVTSSVPALPQKSQWWLPHHCSWKKQRCQWVREACTNGPALSVGTLVHLCPFLSFYSFLLPYCWSSLDTNPVLHFHQLPLFLQPMREISIQTAWSSMPGTVFLLPVSKRSDLNMLACIL